MKTVKTVLNNTKIIVLDEKGFASANHEYKVVPLHDDDEVFASISFQKGPIKENGVNGCSQEDLLEIVMHRLRSFQYGKYGCDENAVTIKHVEEALISLYSRTSKREQRGVEGASIK